MARFCLPQANAIALGLLGLSAADSKNLGIIKEGFLERGNDCKLFWRHDRNQSGSAIGASKGGIDQSGLTVQEMFRQSVHQSLAFSVRELPGHLFARLVPDIDWILRRLMGIFEFDQDDVCILRISLKACGSDTILSDGTVIHKGEPLGELHFWNEHIPPIPKNGADLSWALAFQRRIVRSFRSLAEFIPSDPAFSRVKAFRGTPPFGGRFGDAQVADMAQRWGFEIIETPAPRGLLKRFYHFWDSFYAWGLMLAFNPGTLHDKRMADLHRNQWWITRHSLFDHYLAHLDPPDQVERVPASTPSVSQSQKQRCNLNRPGS